MKSLAITQILFLLTGSSTNRFLKNCSLPAISLLLIVFCSCSPAYYGFLKETGVKQVNLREYVPVGVDNNKILFRTSIDVYGRHFSGLMFIKYVSDRRYRTVFITEVGMSVFDFEFSRGEFKDCGSLDFIKKPYIIETLKRDLMLILMEDMGSSEREYFTDSRTGEEVVRLSSGEFFNYYFFNKTGTLMKIENSSGLFKKTEIDYIYNDGKISRIKIEHYDADLVMEFDRIESGAGHE